MDHGICTRIPRGTIATPMIVEKNCIVPIHRHQPIYSALHALVQIVHADQVNNNKYTLKVNNLLTPNMSKNIS